MPSRGILAFTFRPSFVVVPWPRGHGASTHSFNDPIPSRPLSSLLGRSLRRRVLLQPLGGVRHGDLVNLLRHDQVVLGDASDRVREEDHLDITVPSQV